MFTIRLVTTIVHTILVVCTIIRPPGRGVALVWLEISCHLRNVVCHEMCIVTKMGSTSEARMASNKCLKR